MGAACSRRACLLVTHGGSPRVTPTCPAPPPPPPAPPAGAADVDELLQALVAAEEANFSLFNYVNDLGGEVDKLEEGIGSLRSAALAWSMLPYWIVQRVVP